MSTSHREGEEKGETPDIPNLRTRWRWVVSFMSCPLYPWKRRLSAHSIGVSQSQREYDSEEISLSLLGIKSQLFSLYTVTSLIELSS
jgi:hypothetical protein